MGNIAQGTTVSDCHFSEKQHQISTQTSLLYCTWMGKPAIALATSSHGFGLALTTSSTTSLVKLRAGWHSSNSPL